VKIRMRYIGDLNDTVMLVHTNVYEATGEDSYCYGVIDETNEVYLYPKGWFEPADDAARAALKAFERKHADKVKATRPSEPAHRPRNQ
jgi:hypothetical protein